MILCFNVMKIKNEINIVNKILPQVFGWCALSCPENIFVNWVPSCVQREALEEGEKGDMKPGHVFSCCPLIGEYFFYHRSSLYNVHATQCLVNIWANICITEAIVFTT